MNSNGMDTALEQGNSGVNARGQAQEQMATRREFLTVQEFARKLRCHPKTVRRMLRDGRLDGVQVGRRWRVAMRQKRLSLTCNDDKQCQPRRVDLG
jgi:excisionase family DNA binding protein